MNAALIIVSLIFMIWAASPTLFLTLVGADRTRAASIENEALNGEKRTLLHKLIVGRFLICWIGAMLLTVALVV